MPGQCSGPTALKQRRNEKAVTDISSRPRREQEEARRPKKTIHATSKKRIFVGSICELLYAVIGASKTPWAVWAETII